MYPYFGRTSLLVLLITLGACASSPSKPSQEEAQLPADAALSPVDPPEAVAAFEQAMQRMSAGDVSGAEREFVELAQNYPTYAGPLINLAILQAKAGRHEDAERSLHDALSRNPNSAPAHNQLGILYRKLGKFKEAGESYARAVQSDPQYALAHLNLGVLCDLYLGQPERALESFERYLQLEGNPQPQVQTWVKELRSRLGVRGPAAADAQPAEPSEQTGSGA